MPSRIAFSHDSASDGRAVVAVDCVGAVVCITGPDCGMFPVSEESDIYSKCTGYGIRRDCDCIVLH